MKSIFCLMKYYLNPSEKVNNPKFDYQIKSLKALEYEVYYLGIKDGYIYLCHNDEREKICAISFSKIHTVSTFATYDAIYRATRIVFQSLLRIEYAYIRSMPTMPSYIKAFEQIKKTKCKIIVEIPTYPIEKEMENEKRLFRKWYFLFSNKYSARVAKYVDLYTLIGEKANEFQGRPALNIENGIFAEGLPLREYQNIDNKIHILALAKIARWHGYDRIIEGLREYKENGGKEKMVIHFIGPEGDGSLNGLKHMAIKYQLDDSVVFEGAQYGEQLTNYFNIAQLAIGSIGLHRKGLNSTAELKVREYMARGLPFILSAKDQSIDESLGFYLKVSEDNSPIDIEATIRFIRKTGNDHDISWKMRQYAIENLTWQKQFIKIFLYLEKKNIIMES